MKKHLRNSCPTCKQGINFFLCATLLLAGFSMLAQEIRTNDKGEKIVVFPDGTWVPLKEKSAPERNMSEAERAKWLALRRDSSAQFQMSTIKDSLETALAARKKTEEDYARVENEPGKRAALEQTLTDQLATIKRLGEVYKKAKLWAAFTPSLVNLPLEKQEKLIKSWEKEHQTTFEKNEPQLSTVSNPAPPQTLSFKAPAPVAVPVETIAAKLPCRLEFDGVDEFSGLVRKDVAKAHFFSFTPDHLRKFFPNEELLTCFGSISTSRGFFFLNLEVAIHSKNAGNSYGLLEKGSTLHIKLLDGENIRLLNNQTDLGFHQPGQVISTYKAQYPLDVTVVQKLKNGEVDKVRLFWSSGYEDYEVYEVDFFRNQFACIEGG